jgi:hypothetical protein
MRDFWPWITPVKYFFDICQTELLQSGQKMQKSAKIGHSKSIFYVEKSLNLSKKNLIEEHKFRTTFFIKIHFLITSIFKSLFFLKMGQSFVDSNFFLHVSWYVHIFYET